MTKKIIELRRVFYLNKRMHTVADVPGMRIHYVMDDIAVITYPNRSPLLATNGPMGDLVLTDLPKPRLYKSRDGGEWLCADGPSLSVGRSWQGWLGGFVSEWGFTVPSAYAGWVTTRLS